MPTLSARAAYLSAVLAGAGLWLATTALSGRREAWDSSLYWSAAYPLAIAAGGMLGYLAPDRPWRWGLVVMLAQAVTLAGLASSFGLLPLGLVMFAVLAVPPMIAARLAAGVRMRRGEAPN